MGFFQALFSTDTDMEPLTEVRKCEAVDNIATAPFCFHNCQQWNKPCTASHCPLQPQRVHLPLSQVCIPSAYKCTDPCVNRFVCLFFSPHAEASESKPLTICATISSHVQDFTSMLFQFEHEITMLFPPTVTHKLYK